MFYEFNQNNSGGSFSFDKSDGITRFVIIEADSPIEANSKAESIGIYFDGCSTGSDCPCCGDRWYSLWDDEKGTDEPLIYGKSPNEYVKEEFTRWMDEDMEIAVHHKDGKIDWF